jgi:tetrahydromethanopterin S-methyltransferase subunit D
MFKQDLIAFSQPTGVVKSGLRREGKVTMLIASWIFFYGVECVVPAASQFNRLGCQYNASSEVTGSP